MEQRLKAGAVQKLVRAVARIRRNSQRVSKTRKRPRASSFYLLWRNTVFLVDLLVIYPYNWSEKNFPSAGWGMPDYYGYLWKATWIESTGFLVLCLFVIARLGWKGWQVWKVYKEQGGRWRIIAFFLKGLGWAGILAVYLLMLYSSEPDWFSQPQWIQGEIQGKAMTQSSIHPYTVDVKTDNESITVMVDGLTYRELTPGQKVKMSILPHRLEVVTCEILP